MAILLSAVAVLISLAAVAVAVWTAKSNSRSADAAEGAEEAADRAAAAGERSAKAAELSAASARDSAAATEEVARVEAEREHETRRPRPEAGVFAWGPESEQPRPFNLTFTVPRSYLMSVYAHHPGRGSQPLEVNQWVRAGEKVVLLVDQAGEDNRPSRLQFLFWPPEPGSAGEQWSCRCGRPMAPRSPRGGPHWEVNVEVPAPDPLGEVGF